MRFRRGDSPPPWQSLRRQKTAGPAAQNRAMGNLYLVRHAQASFAADDYDQLSELGQRQAQQLGRYWAERGQGFDAVFTGELRRHAQTWDGIAAGTGLTLQPLRLPTLNEYNPEALIRCVHPQPLPRADSPERYRQHFRLLRDGLAQWMAGTVSPQGMPSYEQFAQGVAEVLARVRAEHQGQNVLIVSSGGPIATAVAQVLGMSPEGSIELNLRIRNCALSELPFSARRHSLLSFNTLPHLDALEHRDWISYA